MKTRDVQIGGVVMLIAALLSSCASTSLLTSWTDPEAVGKGINKCMVIGVSNKGVLRRRFEDAFVVQLKKLGATAIPSYPLLPDASAINEQGMAPVVKQNQIDHLVIVRVVDKRTVRTYVPPSVRVVGFPSYFPPYYANWYGFYGYQFSTVTTPGYTYDTRYVNLETNVYDSRSGKLIWSGLTETELGSKLDAQIEELVSVLTTAMKKDKIL